MLVQVAARQRGRPFRDVLELLPNPDEEGETQHGVPLSPEEVLLRDLVNLAVTIRDDGQVNPLTVVDVSQGVTLQFRIETGERRSWASWLLRDFMAGYSGDGMIPCLVIPTEHSSVFRQAKENTARSGLWTIAMARQAALRDNWQFEQTNHNSRQTEPERDANTYITGKYAEFIQW